MGSLGGISIAIVVLICLIAAGYLLMIRPAGHSGKRTKSLDGWNYAHRGLYIPDRRIHENTMEAFEQAVLNGFGIELDIHLTKDGELVVFHDDNLNRMCGVDKIVEEQTAEEIAGLFVGGGDARIPLFRDVLKRVDGKVPLIIEIKAGKNVDLICKKTNELLDSYRGVFCVESFNPYVVYWYARHRPELIRGQLSMNFMKSKGTIPFLQRVAVTYLLMNFLTKPDFIAYRNQDTRNLSYRICRSLFKTTGIVWTIRSKEDFHRAKEQHQLVIFENFLPDQSEAPECQERKGPPEQ